MRMNVRKLTTLGMLAALSYIIMVAFKIPVFPGFDFLKYEPKDVIITIGGFIYGPAASLLMSVSVSLIEMITVSNTGLYGFLMNVISTVSFACTATYIYKKDRSLKGALIGLAAGCVLNVIIMLAWNFIITPLYMKVARDVVAKILVPVILPFNLLKCVINSSLIILLYKPIVETLRRINFVSTPEREEKGRFNIGLLIATLLVLATCILFVLILKGII